MSTRMPAQRPGLSRQDYGTPPELLAALAAYRGIVPVLDAAASPENAICPHYYTEVDDAITKDWGTVGWVWCNPPFANITPWVEKAYTQSLHPGSQVAMLVPASVGSNWWRNHVDGKAHVLFLNPRLTFVGCTDPYPKDCALLLYTPFIKGGYEVWKWS